MTSKILLLSAVVFLLNVSHTNGNISDVTTKGCAVTKSCFRLPSGCKDQSDCDLFSSWTPVMLNGNQYLEVEVFGKVESNEGYVAIGFSEKKGMNDAAVIGCYIESSGSAIKFRAGYNTGWANKFVTAPANFLVTSGPGSEDRLGGFFIGSRKMIVCRIRRMLIPSSNVEQLKNLSAPNSYHILISRSNKVSSSGLGKHFSNGKAVSDATYEVGANNASSAGSTGDLLIKTHGALMIVAWMFCAHLGIIMARYMKPMWPNTTFCGLKVWFQIHRTIQILCVLLSTTAFVIIFVKIGGYAQLTMLPDKVHPILGIIVMTLALLNPITAIFRPASDAPRRPIFNWVHFCIGSMAQIFSVATMFIGIKLQKTGMQFSSSVYPFWILVGFVGFHVLMEIAFAVCHYCMKTSSTRNTSDKIEMRNASGIQADDIGDSTRYIYANGVKREVSQTGRSVLLAIYFIGTLGCTTALVTLLFVN